MRTQERNGNAKSRRFLIAYIVLVAIPAGLFSSLAYHAFLSRWTAARTSTRDAEEFAKRGGALVEKIEGRTSALARDCLNDPATRADVHTLMLNLPADPALARNAAAAARQRCPLAADFFLVDNGTVEFPVLRPLSRERAPAASGAAAAALARAEQERRSKKYQPALKDFERSYLQAASDSGRAQALLKYAETLQKMGLKTEAATEYAKIAANYGDLYNREHKPYAIVVAFATNQGPTELLPLYQQLIHGRWDLSGNELEELTREFQRRMGDATPRESTAYLRRFDMARALQQALHKRTALFHTPISGDVGADRPPRPGDMYALALRGADADFQSYYVVLRADTGNLVLWGFSADLDWLQKTVFPDLGVGNQVDVAFTGSVAPRSLRISFDHMFPFWELVPSSAYMQNRLRRIDVITVVGFCALIGVIGIGLVVLYRNVLHERQFVQLRNDFITGVSHELKTPITVVKLYSETLLEDAELSPRTRECCEIIREETERLTHLVESILEFSPIDRGLKQYQMSRGNLAKAIAPTLAVYRDYLGHKGVKLSVNLADNLPPVSFDTEAVKSAVLNLVDNAVKYSGASDVVWVSLAAEGARVALAVADAGIGIPPAEREKIFQPFYRVDTGISRGGCGLGLFLVQQVMQAHQGTVEVNERAGGGSIFRLLFPVAGEAAGERNEDALPATA